MKRCAPASTRPASAPKTLGVYRVRETLRQGRDTAVYGVQHPALPARFAIKTTLGSVHDRRVNRRLLREGALLRSVDNVHVVRALDAFVDDARVCLVLERLPGVTLRDRARETVAPWRSAFRIAAQVLEGLDAIHGCGMVHGDIKPDNIMVDGVGPAERATIIDFGVARTVKGDAPKRPLGTPSYMAPEQARCEGLDHRADLYGLGATLYRTLTGRPPHVGGTVQEVLASARRGEIVPVRMLNPSVPDTAAQIVERCMSCRVSDRFETARAMSDAVERVLSTGGAARDASAAAVSEGGGTRRDHPLRHTHRKAKAS